MKKSIGIVLAVLALVSLACRVIAGKQEGNLLYIVLDEDGRPSDELVLSDVGGKEIRRIQLPDIPQLLYSTRAGQTALAMTVDDRWYLIRTDTGDVDRLPFSADIAGEIIPDLPGFRGVPSSRWLVIGHPRGAPVFLLDLETGDREELTTEGIEQLFYGTFSSDGKYLLASGKNTWLIPTDDPDAARQIGDDASVYSVNFSRDGKRLAYVQRLEGGRFRVVTENLDGSGRDVVLTREDLIATGLYASDENHLMIAGRSDVLLYDIDSRSENTVLELPRDNTLNRWWLSSDRQDALIGYGDGDQTLWSMLDLQKGDETSLDDLTGFNLMVSGSTYRWLIFVDDLTVGNQAHFYSLEVGSNDVRSIRGVAKTATFFGIRDISTDGKYTLVTMKDDEDLQLWILDAEKGEATLLGEASGVVGTLSPEAGWVVVAEYDRERKSIQLVTPQGEQERSIGEGFAPIWVRP